jgi:MFS transporter, Spinster family, sphingosine-1-phosphate transporter
MATSAPVSDPALNGKLASYRWLGFEWPHFTGWQWKVLVVLTLINFLNYFDRLIVFPMFPLLKEEFSISDFQLGLLGSVFITLHSLAVLPFGHWSDRGSRQKIMAFGVSLWSAATALSGLAMTFRMLLVGRALVGIGEGAYSPAGTAMISDSFPRSFRARVQGIFNMGMLVGGVCGLAVGGLLSQWIGWRYAFFLVGLPGFLLALTVYRMKVPVTLPSEKPPSALSLLKIPAYLMVMAGGMFVVFSSTALITWGPTFANRYHNLNVAQAASWMGGLVLVGSVGGVLVGSYVADSLQSRWSFGRALTIAVTLLAGTPFMLVAVNTDSLPMFLACLFVASFLLTCYHGPATAVIHDLTPPRAHSFAFALYAFVIHLFGDAMAPVLVGKVSDVSELRHGLQIGVGANAISAGCFLAVAWLIARRPRNGAL